MEISVTDSPAYRTALADAEERGYEKGRRMALLMQLQNILHLLGYEDESLGDRRLILGRMVKEREDTLAQLRDVCGEFGDQDWTHESYLADVVEKHLGKHLYASQAGD